MIAKCTPTDAAGSRLPWKGHFEPEAEAFAARDETAIATLMERHRRALVGWAWRYLDRQMEYPKRARLEDAEDVVQATYLKVWRARKNRGFDHGRVPVFIWLRTCLRNHVTRWLEPQRTKKRTPPGGHVASLTYLREGKDFQTIDSTRPEDSVIQEDTRRAILDAIEKLKGPRKETMTLFMDGLRPFEIAKHRGVSRTTVGIAIKACMEPLAEHIVPALGGQPG